MLSYVRSAKNLSRFQVRPAATSPHLPSSFRQEWGCGLKRVLSALIVLLWLVPTTYLLVAGLWILVHIRFAAPPFLYLGGLAIAVVIWWFVTKSLVRTVRRLWRR
jgi:predicted neutral ceramidase superfamily lipid hydrolase